jgi:hypothetical protein
VHSSRPSNLDRLPLQVSLQNKSSWYWINSITFAIPLKIWLYAFIE